MSEFEPLLEDLTHTRSCPALTPGNDGDCTCGLKWRIRLRTEIEMHNAWRKRAEEAEAPNNLITALEGEGLVKAANRLRSALDVILNPKTPERPVEVMPDGTLRDLTPKEVRAWKKRMSKKVVDKVHRAK
jgi:hypothetical protein